MPRELVTIGELNERLTAELQQVEDCEGSEIRVSYPLREPDADGCNWSTYTIRVGPRANSEYLKPIAAGIVDRARTKFNLKD